MRVVVCGAGIAGLTLATRLADQGAEVVLLERSARPRDQGYMIDFFGPGYDAVERMGLLPEVLATGYRVREASLVDGHGRRRAAVRYPEFAKAVGGRLVSILRPDLERVLREHLPASVDVRWGVSPVAVGDGVTLDDGTGLAADLVVGADGIRSTVRRLVFGPEHEFVRHLGFHTAAWQFDAPGPHAASQDRFRLTDSIGRQLGFYALRSGRLAAFAVHRTPDPVAPQDIRARILEVYDGLVPGVLDHLPPAEEIYYDQVAQSVLPAWHRGRTVLVGDACGAVSLLAGQGASLGIAGAYLLAEQLARFPVERALAEYERRWRPVVEEKQRVARAGARWFLPASPAQLRVRRLALHAARLPLVNRLVARNLVGKPVRL
ncbi:2-polyprenyl-6-methoxyphenol hydroxylase-like FAD-dependent oxidoreductase [Crossiella equi]|uniref:2-polyprenyl-6-methoxyphenol hydroxylase-like FAD-dependent oxidoreductase n=1 Tax=Crossiella equi TaxID=130796 RepID=A0ABS5A4T7_9PSEU|nr:FAD-dependent oxidoreductase [Crossiella equi]MBP2471592.1 2-polyprenyl-6-methoxyphenol hydroxylase-like FAD-dependent oxidoreductase [Crossiella equi]